MRDRGINDCGCVWSAVAHEMRSYRDDPAQSR